MAIVSVKALVSPRRWPSPTRLANPSSSPRGNTKALHKDPEVGRTVGDGVFLVSSIALGSWGSIRILSIPGRTLLRVGVGGRAGGVTIGRLDLMYGSETAKDGITILNINNNAGKYSFASLLTMADWS